MPASCINIWYFGLYVLLWILNYLLFWRTSRKVVHVTMTLPNLFFFSRSTQDIAGPVSDKDSSVHRPSKLKVPGGLAYCQGDERLLKTQVWQRLTEVRTTPGISTGTDSLVQTMQPLIFLSVLNPKQRIVFSNHCVMFFSVIWSGNIAKLLITDTEAQLVFIVRLFTREGKMKFDILYWTQL